jgi:hypothetical protein
MLLYTCNLIPKTPARILGKHCQIMFLRTFGSRRPPTASALLWRGPAEGVSFFRIFGYEAYPNKCDGAGSVLRWLLKYVRHVIYTVIVVKI